MGGTGRGNEKGEPEHKKSIQNRELKRKSLIGLGFKFLLPFHFPDPRSSKIPF